MKSMAMPHLMPQRQGPHKKIHANVRVFEACFEGKLYRITRTFELGRAGVWSQCLCSQTPTVVFLRNFTVKTCLVNVYGKKAPWVP